MEARQFLSVVIASGLDFDMLSPDDVLRHVTMDVLAHQLPVELKAMLISEALRAEFMTAATVLDTLGIEAIAEHVPAALLWDCVAESARHALGEKHESVPAAAEPSKAVTTPRPQAKPAAATRKPNRSAQPAPTATRKREKTLAEKGAEEDSFSDGDTSVGMGQSVDEAEHVEENLSFPADGDEVTTFGQE